MILLCYRNYKLYYFCIIKNIDYKNSEYKQFSIIDLYTCNSILSLNKCYLDLIIKERMFLEYTILDFIKMEDIMTPKNIEVVNYELLEQVKKNGNNCLCTVDIVPCMCEEFKNMDSGICHCGVFKKQ